MHVILTHEQADFDAIAALLGARLLDDQALAVLPRRMNRNARAYLSIYGAELPFVDPRDLSGEPIEAVTLVDTQSLVTIKGLTRKTSVSVIDHHPRREDLPDGWRCSIEPIGATTTQLVEAIADRNGNSLSVAEATLLLLGIYEDTGSLTYAATTVRDIKAAAWLIEHGASLKMLGQYLDPPLSSEQKEVYGRLMDACTIDTIQGQKIAIAAVEALNLTDEISSIAHKMREVLNPDGLFLLVRTSEGIRIVARSVSDRVNVARILARFGGGGHDRAASCLVQPESKEDSDGTLVLGSLVDRVKAALKEEIPPMITVEQIMSKNPRLIEPSLSVGEALALMQRYGYEGFPVADQGRVIGLLTRRAVDRAISHKLNLPAARLMDAGQVSIRPDASVDQLRELVVSSGWGQIPVVNENTGEVVGIVTRTDLIKIMTPEQGLQRHTNLAGKLEAALPHARITLLKAVMDLAGESHMPLYIVGGYVRDLLLERPGIDFDLVVEGDALLLGRNLSRKYGGRTITHSRFGTAKWLMNRQKPAIGKKMGLDPEFLSELPDSLDLISARTEFYNYPTALPTVESSGIKLDLHRRDFTINTLALRLDGRHYGELHDYWGGLKDLRKGLIRVLHSLSFIDDPTRLMRAVRFEQRFGFRIEKRTLELMEDAFEIMKQVSGDRLRHEVNLILQEAQAGAILKRLDQLGILGAIHPDLAGLADGKVSLPLNLEEDLQIEWGIPAELFGMDASLAMHWLVWLGVLPAGKIVKVSHRLRLPAGMKSSLLSIAAVLGLQAGFVHEQPSRIVIALEGHPMSALLAARLILADQPSGAILDRYARTWRHVEPGLNGSDLSRMGLKPSPRYRRILEGLRAAWLDGLVKNPEDERSYLERLIAATEKDAPEESNGRRKRNDRLAG